MPRRLPCGHPGLFHHRGLITLVVGLPVLEVLVLVGLGMDPAIAPHVSAVPPFGVFHDLRWVLTMHAGWGAFVAELLLAIVVRGVFIGLIGQLGWPAEDRPSFRRALRRGMIFAAAAHVALLPWAALLFGMAVAPVSWLFIAGVTSVLFTAVLIHRGAVAHDWWRGWRLRPVGWTALSFLVLSAGSGAVALAPWWPLAAVAAALVGLFNAWAWYGIVHHEACSERTFTSFPLVPVAGGVMLVAAVSVSWLAFDVITGGDAAGGGPQGPVEDQTIEGKPVLVANGFSSSWVGVQEDVLPDPYHEVRYSYLGLGPDDRPLPYEAEATFAPIEVLVERMAAQVEVLHERSGRDVAVIAQSEGSLIAQLYAMTEPEHVDTVLLLSPLVRPARVYYPDGLTAGWGVAGGAALGAVSDLIGAISPYDAQPDLPFFRSIVEHGPTVRALASCPPAGPQLAMIVPFADGLTLPTDLDSPIPMAIVAAWHAGFLAGDGTQDTVLALLDGGPAPDQPAWSVATHIGKALANGWHVPTVPVSLPEDWDDGPMEPIACEEVRRSVDAWLDRPA